MLDTSLFSRRRLINQSLRQIRWTKAVDALKEKAMADDLNQRLHQDGLGADTVSAVLKSLLQDKRGYVGRSWNAAEDSIMKLGPESAFQSWEFSDLFLFHWPQRSAPSVYWLKQSEKRSIVCEEDDLLVLYLTYPESDDLEKVFSETRLALAGKTRKKWTASKSPEKKISKKSPSSLQPQKPSAFKEESTQVEKAVVKSKASQPLPSQASSTKPKISQPMGISVSNELFHNGNVEAWKRIITSYETTYPDAEVIIYYEGEKVEDIHSLFEWGKVNNGNILIVRVRSRSDLRSLAALKKYLYEGASVRFERFLKGSPDRILKLF